MKNLLSSLNIFNWPMWVKLAGGFLIAILIPVLLLIIIAQNGFTEISTTNLRAYIEEQSEHQKQEINTSLQETLAAIDNIASDGDGPTLLNQLFEENGEDRSTIDQIGSLLGDALDESDLFRRLFVLDSNGNLLLQTTNAGTSTTVDDLNSRPAYTQARTALLEAHDQSIAVSNNPALVQVTTALRNTNGALSGFLVGEVNIEAVIATHLDFANPVYRAYSYLVTSGDDPVVIAQDGTQDVVQRSMQASEIIPQVLQGTSGTDTYAIGAQRDSSVIGHYTPIFSPTHSKCGVIRPDD